MKENLFYIFATLTIVFSLLVILLKNPIASGLSLVVSFFFVSAIFILMQASFLSLIQILVYTGAIMVLFLYVMMLLNLEHPEAPKGFRKYSRYIWILMLPVIATMGVMLIRIPELNKHAHSEDFGSIHSIGTLLLGNYVFAFEAVSFVLLAAMVGVVVLTHKRRGSK
jgi:NADH-quinone oxidoreductase subunit J